MADEAGQRLEDLLRLGFVLRGLSGTGMRLIRTSDPSTASRAVALLDSQRPRPL